MIALVDNGDASSGKGGSSMRRFLVCMMGAALFSAFALAIFAQEGTVVERGRKVAADQKCIVCHSIEGKGNKRGSLDEVGSKWTADELREWVTSPQEMAKKKNVKMVLPMKSYSSLPKGDIDALVEFLTTLKPRAGHR
jgi:cytochrome c2